MGKMMVTIVDPTQRETTVEVPDDRPVGAILERLTTMLDLPRQGGRSVLFCKRTGKDLDDSKTLGQEGIQSYEVLRLRIEPTPGGRLTGDSTPATAEQTVGWRTRSGRSGAACSRN